jgi:hypothetical protein
MWLGSPLRTIGTISQVKFTESRNTIRPRRSPTVAMAQQCWCCRWAFSLATYCGERTLLASVERVLPGAPLLSGALRAFVICHRGRRCARAAGAGHIRHRDGVRDHVRRVDAGALRLRSGWAVRPRSCPRSSSARKRSAIPTPLRIFGWTATTAPPTPKRSLGSSLGVGN